MDQESLKKLHEAAKKLDFVKSDIHEVAYRLYDVGLEKLSTELNTIAKEVGEVRKMVDAGTSGAVKESLRRAEETSASMLDAVLAGLSAKDANPGAKALAFVARAAHDAMTVKGKTDETGDLS